MTALAWQWNTMKLQGAVPTSFRILKGRASSSSRSAASRLSRYTLLLWWSWRHTHLSVRSEATSSGSTTPLTSSLSRQRSYLRSGAADEGPHRQQASRQTDDEDEDVEDGERSHLVVDDAARSFCIAGVGGRSHHQERRCFTWWRKKTIRKYKMSCRRDVACLEEAWLLSAAVIAVWSSAFTVWLETGRAATCEEETCTVNIVNTFRNLKIFVVTHVWSPIRVLRHLNQRVSRLQSNRSFCVSLLNVR